MKVKYFFKYIADYIENGFDNLIYKAPNIMSSEETLDYILKKHINICRYGDGELRLMRGIDLEFQRYNKRLAEKLKQIKTTESCLVCLPDIYNLYRFNNDNIIPSEYNYWKKFKRRRGGLFRRYFSKNIICGDAFLSRFYLRYKNKSNVGTYINKLKKLWYNKNILIVEGETSQVGVGNDMLDNARTIRRIECPNIDAFDYYDEIVSLVKGNYNKGDLVLIALGPTATVLAYDLSKLGIWALDMGHFDIEYEWFLAKTDKKIPVKNKHVNECGTMGQQTQLDKKYLSEIVANIGNEQNEQH